MRLKPLEADFRAFIKGCKELAPQAADHLKTVASLMHRYGVITDYELIRLHKMIENRIVF